MTIKYIDFEKVDIRVGEVLKVQEFSEGRYSSHILEIDFGPEIGVKTSLARLIPNYEGQELVGRQVLGVVNLESKQIGKYMSETLTLGFADKNGDVVLAHPGKEVPLGNKLY